MTFGSGYGCCWEELVYRKDVQFSHPIKQTLKLYVSVVDHAIYNFKEWGAKFKLKALFKPIRIYYS